MKDDRERLKHIFDTIVQIEQMTADITEDGFKSSVRDQLAVSMCFAIIGEAASRLQKELRDKHPGIPWNSIIGMRHVLVHDYMKISQTRIWDAVKNDVPVLKKQIQKIMENMPNQ